MQLSSKTEHENGIPFYSTDKMSPKLFQVDRITKNQSSLFNCRIFLWFLDQTICVLFYLMKKTYKSPPVNIDPK